mgnify:CR=1 FL=1
MNERQLEATAKHRQPSKEVQLEDDYVSYEIVEDDKELDMISDIFNALLDGLEVSL